MEVVVINILMAVRINENHLNLDPTSSRHVEPTIIRAIEGLWLRCSNIFTKLKSNEIVYGGVCLSLQYDWVVGVI